MPGRVDDVRKLAARSQVLFQIPDKSMENSETCALLLQTVVVLIDSQRTVADFRSKKSADVAFCLSNAPGQAFPKCKPIHRIGG